MKRCESVSKVVLLSSDSNPLESMQSLHNQLSTSDEPDSAANSSSTQPGYSCFFVAEMPPVQRRTSDACASIILCALSCQSCTRSLPACAPGSGLKLMSLTMLNQLCQSWFNIVRDINFRPEPGAQAGDRKSTRL